MRMTKSRQAAQTAWEKLKDLARARSYTQTWEDRAFVFVSVGLYNFHMFDLTFADQQILQSDAEFVELEDQRHATLYWESVDDRKAMATILGVLTLPEKELPKEWQVV